MKFKWINDFSETQIEEVLLLMKNEWWCRNRKIDDVLQVLKNSDITIGAVDNDGVLSGFARVLTDYTYKALIFDVITKSNCRNIGLGKEIIQHILDMPSLNSVQSFELYCPESISGFYKKLGFKNSESKLLIFEN